VAYEGLADCLEIGENLLAAEEVFDSGLADAIDHGRMPHGPDYLSNARENLERHTGRLGRAE
jgi:hypothetical protein